MSDLMMKSGKVVRLVLNTMPDGAQIVSLRKFYWSQKEAKYKATDNGIEIPLAEWPAVKALVNGEKTKPVEPPKPKAPKAVKVTEIKSSEVPF